MMNNTKYVMQSNNMEALSSFMRKGRVVTLEFQGDHFIASHEDCDDCWISSPILSILHDGDKKTVYTRNSVYEFVPTSDYEQEFKAAILRHFAGKVKGI